MMKKNVIVILIDGGRVDFVKKSPNFIKLQENSIFFPNSITYAPYTNASMHAFISGSYGNRNGTYSYWHSSNFKGNEFKTLTDYLKEYDFSTCFDGHSDLILPKKNFDQYFIHDENEVDLVKKHGNLLKEMKRVNDENKNFFLYLHYSQIHTGLKNEVLIPFDNFSKEYFDDTEKNKKRYLKLFQNASSYLDDMMSLIQLLEFDKNSIVLILSDHGVSIGEKIGERGYGAFCYDYTIKTFAYLQSPGIKSDTIVNQVRHIDFLPTILDLLDIKIDDSFSEIDGKSLVPLINKQNCTENIAFSETGNPLHEKSPPKIPNVKSIRTSEWKLILNEYDDTKELYNISKDPFEKDNLIGKKPDIESKLWAEFLKIERKSLV
jgi:arylsulfatase A-like enzyme